MIRESPVIGLSLCRGAAILTDSTRGIQYRFLYFHIAAATAEVACEVGPHLLGARCRVLFEQTLSTQDETRSAISTLKSVVIDERLLNGMQFAGLGQSLDSENLFTFRQSCK